MSDQPDQKDNGDTTAIDDAAREAAQGDPAADVRRWLLEATSATLCTVCARDEVAGFPFGSIVPYALLADGTPVIMIAKIAQHTRNLVEDARASLFVHEPGREGDPQSGWRATLLGHFERVLPASRQEQAAAPLSSSEGGAGTALVDDDAFEELVARYRERVPGALGYQGTHGFEYWRLVTTKVRYIAGFGKITWLAADVIARDPGGAGIKEAAPGAVQHMNVDHSHNLVEMCRAFYGFEPDAISLIGADRTGFLARSTGPDRLLSFSFGREVDADGLRAAAVDLVKRARVELAR